MAKAPTGDDPFFEYRNNILKNVPGYTDQAKLDKFERFTTAAAAVELELDPVRGSFDRAHLQQIHKRLFEEVYPWAGEPRPTDLRRADFPPFVRKEFLGVTLDNTLAALAAEKHLKGSNAATPLLASGGQKHRRALGPNRRLENNRIGHGLSGGTAPGELLRCRHGKAVGVSDQQLHAARIDHRNIAVKIRQSSHFCNVRHICWVNPTEGP
jgi:hypothetical protein